MNSSEPVVFRYKRLPWVCLWTVGISMFNVWVIVTSIRNGTWESDRVPACFLATFLWLTGAFLTIASSDVIIDDEGISRRLFGVVWKRVCWSNALAITEFPVSDGYGKTVRAFNIFPRRKPLFRFLPSGKMWFTEGVGDVASIVGLLNFHAQKNGIRFEVSESVGRVPKSVPRL